MGLLDQVLSQVLGGGGPMAGTAPPPGSGAGGGLGNLLSGNRAPIAMALLAVLASKHLNNGAGGYGSALRDMFSGGTPSGAASSSRNSSGGLLDKLSGMFGGSGSGAPTAGGLGSLLGGGVTGGALASGLGDLLQQFTRAGHGDVSSSWVATGPNAPVSPDQVSQALNPSDVDELSRQTGLSRGDLLSQLSRVLPQVVDRLTPKGRLPNVAEHSQWI